MNQNQTTAGPVSPSLGSRWVELCVVLVLGMVVYSGSLKVPFLYDDDHAIVNSPYTRTLDRYPGDFRLDNLFNRPVLMFTFAINRHLGGLDVTGYHWVNIGIHLLVTLVFYFVVLELLALEGSRARDRLQQLPFLASALFVVHPLSVQAVTYLSSRSSLLATLFYLLAFICFVRFLRKADKPAEGNHFLLGLGLLFFFLGCGTKAIIITLPVMALVFWTQQSRGENIKKNWPLVLLLLVPLFWYLYYRSQQVGPLMNLPQDPNTVVIDRTLYFLTQIRSFVFYYLLKFSFPVNLNFEPDVRLVESASDPGIWLAIGVIAVLVYGLAKARSALMAFGFIWLVVTLAPTSSLVPLKQIVTEHRMYLPSLGLCLLTARAFIFLKIPMKKDWLVPLVILALLSVLTQLRVDDYKTDVLLWEDSARKSPRKSLVHNNLASAYIGEKRFKEAMRELEVTLELDPMHPQANNNLGYLLVQEKEYKKALNQFLKAVQVGPNNPVAYFNVGLTFMKLEDPKQALPFLEEAVRQKPLNAYYRFELAKTFQSLRMFDEAILEYRKSLELDPNNPMAHNNMGTIYWSMKSFYFADAEFHKAFDLNNNLPIVLSNLASSYILFKNYDAAVKKIERWLELEPDNESAKQLLIATRRLQNQPKP